MMTKVFATSGPEKTGQLHVKKMQLEHFLTFTTIK